MVLQRMDRKVGWLAIEIITVVWKHSVAQAGGGFTSDVGQELQLWMHALHPKLCSLL